VSFFVVFVTEEKRLEDLVSFLFDVGLFTSTTLVAVLLLDASGFFDSTLLL
jgi:hypothetical protein